MRQIVAVASLGLFCCGRLASADDAFAQGTEGEPPRETPKSEPTQNESPRSEPPQSDPPKSEPPREPTGEPPTPETRKTEPESEPRRLGIGGDLLFVIPLGTLGDISGPLIGPVLRISRRVTPRVELMMRAGYLFGLSKDRGAGNSSSVTYVPIGLGGRYFVLRPHAGLYAGAEVGLNLSQLHLDPDPGAAADSAKKLRARVGYNLGVGYVISTALPIDFRIQLIHFNLLGTDTGDKPFVGLGLSAGYAFPI